MKKEELKELTYLELLGIRRLVRDEIKRRDEVESQANSEKGTAKKQG